MNIMGLGRIIWNIGPKNSLLSHLKYVSCWSCGKNDSNLLSNLFCPHCKALQKPDKSENFFKILGVKETYDLDETELSKKYKDLQKNLHPDKYANRNKEEQDISAQYSSMVNDAYKTLLEPLARGVYMLRLRGKEIPENTEADQEFLMKIMEKNEEVEEANTEEEIMKLNRENKAIIQDLQKKLSRAFFDGDLKRVTKLLTYMKYYTINAHYPFSRVLNGSPTTIQQYPILAQLLLDAWGNQQYVQHCAGVILTSRHLISSAHCFQYSRDTGRDYSLPQYWKVRVGSTYRTRGGVLHKIKTIIPHYGFDKSYYTNDIAVVVVAKKFTIGNLVRQGTIIKPDSELLSNSVCTLVGWGVIEKNGPQPDQLQHTMLLVIEQEYCKAQYQTLGAIITDSMLCAGRMDVDGVDGCFGDSGGPLIYKGVVVGLVSFGYACGQKFYPGVYTKVSHYTDWIIKTISNNK
ncbi:trypsin, alkaline C-like [Maniola jurtina]|uniref:trypsin, alkaline C-like n=1 Tax=Maniola jurtina TaxID=191418 RepID=UPI001E6889F5|nr:trypsin, alkaline C-like [Maniola jurtina]